MNSDYKKIFLGIVLVLAGILFLLRQFDLVFFHWRLLLDFWPLIIIYFGITLLPVRNSYKLIFSIIALILVVFFVWYFSIKNPVHNRCPYKHGFRHETTQL